MFDLCGEKFGNLTVLSKSDDRGNRNQIKWNCLCDCGNKHTVTGESLRHGKSKSCGCIKSGRPINFKEDRETALWQRLYSSTIQKRSNKKGYKTDISIEKFIDISKKECFYCGDINSQKLKDRSTDSLITFNGIDRVDSNKGYLISNVVSCCKHCNTAKNTMSQKEFKNHIRRIYEYFVK